ncbi:MAG TPA: hypothetical protein VFH54_15625 [Mycobacteriales bacterium]|jgi:hypothetical protein|nr:hypothetical protein [Mycobacteriales bacterium]HET7407577.1 hypothetical protein [Mycobacteriales bacterium]
MFALSEDEAVAVSETLAALLTVLPPGRDDAYRALATAVTSREVGDEQVPLLQRACALALETGKAREIGRAESERLLLGVYRRTPGGKALSAEAADVNKVLARLAGRTLTSARITARMPGRYLLNLVVDGVDVALAIEPEGLEVRHLQTG